MNNIKLKYFALTEIPQRWESNALYYIKEGNQIKDIYVTDYEGNPKKFQSLSESDKLKIDLNNILIDISYSINKIPENEIRPNLILEGDINIEEIISRYIEVYIKSNLDLWKNYNPKLILERYKSKRIKNFDDDITIKHIKGGWVKGRGGQYDHNRITEFNIDVSKNIQILNIRPETYFIYGKDCSCNNKPLGAMKNRKYQLFRFKLELTYNDEKIYKLSEPFKIYSYLDYNYSSDYGLLFYGLKK